MHNNILDLLIPGLGDKDKGLLLLLDVTITHPLIQHAFLLLHAQQRNHQERPHIFNSQEHNLATLNSPLQTTFLLRLWPSNVTVHFPRILIKRTRAQVVVPYTS